MLRYLQLVIYNSNSQMVEYWLQSPVLHNNGCPRNPILFAYNAFRVNLFIKIVVFRVAPSTIAILVNKNAAGTIRPIYCIRKNIKKGKVLYRFNFNIGRITDNTSII